MPYLCTECRKKPAKNLKKEKREYFCGPSCATKYALKIAAKCASCPKCGSHLTHRRSGGYYFEGQRRCTECSHIWDD